MPRPSGHQSLLCISLFLVPGIDARLPLGWPAATEPCRLGDPRPDAMPLPDYPVAIQELSFQSFRRGLGSDFHRCSDSELPLPWRGKGRLAIVRQACSCSARLHSFPRPYSSLTRGGSQRASQQGAHNEGRE